jgi:hypothetical protein
MPIGPEPVSAVDPVCGLVRLGSASPAMMGVDAAVGALAAEGVLAADGALDAEGDALFDAVDGLEPPPPPPQAVRTSAASSDDINVWLYFISVVLFRRERHVDPATGADCLDCSRFFPYAPIQVVPLKEFLTKLK